MTWRFHFPLRNYDFKAIECITNKKEPTLTLAGAASFSLQYFFYGEFVTENPAFRALSRSLALPLFS